MKQDADTQIIDMLKKNARMPFMQIAKELDVSEGTIRNRVHNMQKKGTIKRFTVETNNKASAIILVNTRAGMNTSSVAGKIKGLGASMVYEVAGKVDIACFFSTRGLDETNDLVEKIRGIDGVISTETIPVLKSLD